MFGLWVKIILNPILGIFPTATTNSISYGRIGANYYFRFMKTLVYLLSSIVLLACGNDNNLNEEELRTYLMGGKWCRTDNKSKCLVFGKDYIIRSSKSGSTTPNSIIISKIDIEGQIIYVNVANNFVFKFQVLGENKINTTVGGETYTLIRN